MEKSREKDAPLIEMPLINSLINSPQIHQNPMNQNQMNINTIETQNQMNVNDQNQINHSDQNQIKINDQNQINIDQNQIKTHTSNITKNNQNQMNTNQILLTNPDLIHKLGDEKKKFIGFQSDRFEVANNSCETIRKLENVFKDKRFGPSSFGALKTEAASIKSQKIKQILDQKSNKSKSFYQTKFMVPPSLQILNNSINNTSIFNVISPQNAKSFHQKSQSQNMKEKKIIMNSPSKKNKEKLEISAQTTKNRSTDYNYRNANTNKILNVTLMALKRSNNHHSKTHEDRKDKSISLERVKENIEKALNKDKNSNISFENIPAFFSNESTNKKTANLKTNPEISKKSYYQLAYLLKEKNFGNKYMNSSKENNESRSRFKSMYTKTEASSKKPNNESIHNISQVIFNKI